PGAGSTRWHVTAPPLRFSAGGSRGRKPDSRQSPKPTFGRSGTMPPSPRRCHSAICPAPIKPIFISGAMFLPFLCSLLLLYHDFMQNHPQKNLKNVRFQSKNSKINIAFPGNSSILRL
ncbi:MAG: hypothetical protein IKD46_04495, partial [Lentisphaeria bacterium]|nr:hypothetical protein [Lentisphaeria bacterium]